MIPQRQGALVENYDNPDFRAGARSVISGVGLKDGAKVPFNFAMDSYVMHEKAWPDIVFNPASRTAWKSVLEDYYTSDEYRTLNEQTRGDGLMSKYATTNFLNTFVSEKKEQGNQSGNPGQDLDKMTAQQLKGISQALKDQAKETNDEIGVAQGFTHLGIPIQQFLDKPDEFRNLAKDRVVVQLVRMLRVFQHTQITKVAKMPTMIGGRPRGIKRMQRYEELNRAVPTELIDEDLLTYKVATRQLQVSERHAGLPNYLIYIDKSGSMTSGIEDVANPDLFVPKISFVAALALAFEENLRKVQAKMTLKLFDVEVHDPVTDRMELIRTLMSIVADSGTDITKVLEDAMTYRDEKVVVFTDGIDNVNESVIQRARGRDIHFVFIDTTSEQLNKAFKNVRIEKIDPSVLMRV